MIYIDQHVELSTTYSGEPESAPTDLKFFIRKPDASVVVADSTLVGAEYKATILVDQSGLWTVDARATLPLKARNVTYFQVNTAPLVVEAA